MEVMAKKAIIVESPTKAKTIKGFLGKDYVVLSSKGHVKDLPKSKLGIDIENNFEPGYITIKGKKKIINELVKATKDMKEIYLGCDPDREGEAIAYHIKAELDLSHEKSKHVPLIKRVLFYEITPGYVREALTRPLEIDLKKVDAHKARRVLDRIVGYFTSPLLWRILRRGLSAGRVQSVALRLISERENEIASFKPSAYWVVDAFFKNTEGIEFPARLIRIKGIEKRLENEADFNKFKSSVNIGDKFSVISFRRYDRKQTPSAPFITSTLQQESIRRLGFSASRTMQIAQSLYEGVDLKEGRIGLITYMRTDSRRVSDTAITEVRDYIDQVFGKEYLSPAIRKYKDRKTSEGAHEAIRPTGIKRTPESVKEFLKPEQYRLYKIIYERFLATQMADAVFEVKEAIVQSQDGVYDFKGEAVKLKFPGHLRAVTPAPATEDEETEIMIEKGFLPTLTPGEPAWVTKLSDEKKFTEPPPRYSEASLIKKLEINGIGRPSTYAKILQTLFERQYIERDRGHLIPTELGMIVNNILVQRFTDIFALPFTANMEEELDQVEEGKKAWQAVVKEFYTPFVIEVKKFETMAPEIKKSLATKTDKTCPRCGHALIVKWGRYGKFYSCEKFPECKYTEPFEQQVKTCPKCNSYMTLRTGKYGKFYACTKYPECRHTERYTPNRAKPAAIEEKE